MENLTVRKVFKCPQCSNKQTILDEEATKKLQASAPPICNNHSKPLKMQYMKRTLLDQGPAGPGVYKEFMCPECLKSKYFFDEAYTKQWKGGEIDGRDQNGRSAASG